MYTKAKIADYWIIDVKKRVFVLRNPKQETYQQETVFNQDATITPLAFPDVAVKVEQLFPDVDCSAHLALQSLAEASNPQALVSPWKWMGQTAPASLCFKIVLVKLCFKLSLQCSSFSLNQHFSPIG